MSRARILTSGLIGLAAAAAAGFRGVAFNFGSMLARYATPMKRSTAQFSDARFIKHPPGTVAQSKRAAIKARNRAKYRAAVAKSGARKNV